MISVSVITTSRADYSIYRPLLHLLQADPEIDLALLVSGSHLDPSMGNTVSEIEQDGFPIKARIPLPHASDLALSVAKQMGHCISAFAASFSSNRPDLLIVLGDRHEMFAATSAAVPFNIPVAHIHGGELTYGAQDENYRHAMTKLCHLHFAATEDYARRVIQMGEQPDQVFNVGALSLDGVKSTPRLSKEELCHRFGLDWNSPPVVATLHAETKASLPAAEFARRFFTALEGLDRTIIITHPNADEGGEAIVKAARLFQQNNPDVYLVPSFGAQAYYSLLEYAAAMAGNSSSGIIEAPFFRLPVVNVGDRQRGRTRSANIIDVAPKADAIRQALDKALSSRFRAGLQDDDHAYGQGDAARKIRQAIVGLKDLQKLNVKEFFDSLA